MPPIPPGFKVLAWCDPNPRGYGVPTYSDDKLWNVRYTHKGSSVAYYYSVSGTVWSSLNPDGPFLYLGRKSDQRVKDIEAREGVTL